MAGRNNTEYGVEYAEDDLRDFVIDFDSPIVQTVIAASTFSWIMLCNIFLISAILTNRRTRKKKSARLILNQSIADFLVGLFGMRVVVLELFSRVGEEKPSQQITLQYFCLLFHYFQGTCALCSIIMMFFINLERYLFICHSFWYRATMRLRHIFYMAGLAWLASALTALLVDLVPKVQKYAENVEGVENDICRFTNESFPDPNVFLFWSLSYILVPLPAITFFNVGIFQTARTSRITRMNLMLGVEMRSATETSMTVGETQSQGQNGQLVSHDVQETRNQTSKNVRTLFLFNIFFVLMWMPLVLLNIFLIIFPEMESLYVNETYMTGYVFLWIATMNSSVNPFLWMMYPHYRRAYWQLLTLACKK